MENTDRILTIYKHPNITALIANVIVLLSLAIIPFAKKTIEKSFLLLSSIIGLSCLALTFSRTGWIAFCISLLFLLIVMRKKTFTIYLLVSLLTIGFMAGVASNSLREKSVTLLHPLNEVNVQKRIVYWNTAIKMISCHPFIGIGLGQKQFMNAYPQYMVSVTDEDPIHSHNTYLHIGATAGIGALIAFMWIIFLVLFRFFRDLKLNKDNSFYKGIYLGTGSAFISFCIVFISECPLYFSNAMLVFWILLAFSCFNYNKI